MSSFLDLLRSRRGTAHPNSPDDVHPNSEYTGTLGTPYEDMAGNAPEPRIGDGLHTMDDMYSTLPPLGTSEVENARVLVCHDPLINPTDDPLIDPYHKVKADYVTFKRDPSLFSPVTKDRARAFMMSTESHYANTVRFAKDRNNRRFELDQKLYRDRHRSEEHRRRLEDQLSKQENQYLRLRRVRLSIDDFTVIKLIGRGAYGEVCLVQKKDNGKIYAMKKLLKAKMGVSDLAHVKSERDVMADSDSPWIVNLYYSFQDATNLYLIMEFLPGGDMMSMLIRYDVFSEDITRFYIAQLVCAIEAVHNMGFIHRDIKPDNILLDKDGHIKLSDFGLSTGFRKTHDTEYYNKLLKRSSVLNPNYDPGVKPRNTVLVDKIHLEGPDRKQMNSWRKSRRIMAFSTVGTPDYIAPEVLHGRGYTKDCDWWSLGTILFECLVGWPPFCADDQYMTTLKIANWERSLYFPEEVELSFEAEHLIRALINHAENRLGRRGSQEIKNHPFFDGVNWDMLRIIQPPFIPRLSSIIDTSYFPPEEELDAAKEQAGNAVATTIAVHDTATPPDVGLPLIGYTYKRFGDGTERT